MLFISFNLILLIIPFNFLLTVFNHPALISLYLFFLSFLSSNPHITYRKMPGDLYLLVPWLCWSCLFSKEILGHRQITNMKLHNPQTAQLHNLHNCTNCTIAHNCTNCTIAQTAQLHKLHNPQTAQ